MPTIILCKRANPVPGEGRIMSVEYGTAQATGWRYIPKTHRS